MGVREDVQEQDIGAVGEEEEEQEGERGMGEEGRGRGWERRSREEMMIQVCCCGVFASDWRGGRERERERERGLIDNRSQKDTAGSSAITWARRGIRGSMGLCRWR